MVGKTDTQRSPLAEAIRALRTQFDETQEEFAKRLDVTVGSIARYETNAPPSRRVLTRLRKLAEQVDRRDLIVFFSSVENVDLPDDEHIAMSFAFARFRNTAVPSRREKMRQLLSPELKSWSQLLDRLAAEPSEEEARKAAMEYIGKKTPMDMNTLQVFLASRALKSK